MSLNSSEKSLLKSFNERFPLVLLSSFELFFKCVLDEKIKKVEKHKTNLVDPLNFFFSSSYLEEKELSIKCDSDFIN